MDRRIIILFLSLFLTSCFDSFDAYTPDNKDYVASNATISDIHTLYSDGLREVDQDVVVEGVVTANDEFGNFFKSFTIEDDGYAIEILDGLFDSYIRHPIGGRVTLRLKGLCLDRYRGILRVGLMAPQTSSYRLDYLTSEAIVSKHVTVTSLGEHPVPQLRTIPELQELHAGELVCIENLQLYADDGAERMWGGYQLFYDAEQNSIWCYTSPYADFASDKVPQCRVSLSGIVEFGSTDSQSDQFIIKLHGSEDCRH